MSLADRARHLEGIDAHRVAEVIVVPADGGPPRRGSGYRVSPEQVLTATHVVAGAETVSARFDADTPTEWMVSAEGWIAAGDIALVSIGAAASRPEVAPTHYGRFGDGAAVIEVHTAGFPRFKLRDDRGPCGTRRVASRYRDLHHAVGWSAVLSNRRDGTLEVTVTPPERDPDPAASPWEGMSGSVVWSAGRIVGVVSFHDRSDGLGRLTATRLDRTLEGLDSGRRRIFRSLLGVPDGVELVDVTPPRPGQTVLSAYLEQVRDIAPVGELLEREAELNALARFCAGDDAYIWWQGDPWAGKSALMSWFVLHPPAGVDVVSFFVTSRLSGQADSDAFTDALIDQLTAIIGESIPSMLTAAARDGQRRRLLREGAERAQAGGRRLVLVVDGLDEDTGRRNGSDRPSIAGLLPKQPAVGLRVVVTSRRNRPVPTDVAADHPFRSCPIRTLDSSPHARNLKDQAVWELDRMLTGDQLQRDVVGLITASGGGLTASDLHELTGRPPFQIDNLLGSAFGRSVRSRGRYPFNERGPRVYLFAHETLHVTAEDRLGQGLLDVYRVKIHRWADTYRQAGWPAGTPQYLLTGYTRINEQAHDVIRLLACATDPSRHDRLFALTGADAAALLEIRTAQNEILALPAPDLAALARLAVHRVHLSERNWHLPHNLPAVWAMLGQAARAEALARTIADPDRQARALADLVAAVAQVGDYDRAEMLALTITDPDRQAQALTDLVAAVARAGEHGRAELLIRTVGTARWHAEAMFELVGAAAQGGDPDRAEAIVSSVADPEWRVLALTGLAGVVTRTGDRDRGSRLIDTAEVLALTITDPHRRAQALTDLAGAAAATGDHGRAEALAGAVADPYWQAQALTDLASVAAGEGDFELAWARAGTIVDPYWRTQALTDLAGDAAQVGDIERVRRIAEAVEAIVPEVDGVDRQAAAVTALAAVVARAGDHDRAEALTRAIFDPDRRAQALAVLVTLIAHGGDHDRAEALTRDISDPDRQAQAITDLAVAAAGAGDRDRAGRLADTAEGLARGINDLDRQARALTDLAAAAIQAGDLDRAGHLAGTAEALARAVADPGRQAQALIALVAVVAQAGDLDRAQAMARGIDDPDQRVQALTDLVGSAAQAGDTDRAGRLADAAEVLARALTDPGRKAQALTDLMTAVAQVGDGERAARLADAAGGAAMAIVGADRQAQALTGLATAATRAGDYSRADGLARAITDSYWRAQAMTALVGNPALGDAQDRIGELIDITGSLVRAVRDADRQAQALTDLAGAAAQAGYVDRAESLVQAIAISFWRDQGLTDLGVVAAQAGDYDRAETLARGISTPEGQSHALTDMMTVAVRAGDRDGARRLIRSAEVSARAITDSDRQVETLTDLAGAAARADERGSARRLIDLVEGLAHAMTDQDRQAQALAGLVAVAARTDDRAEGLVRAIADPYWQAQALALLVSAYVDQVPPHGDRKRGIVRRLLAESLSAAPWQVSLSPLARLSPSAVLALADEFEATALRQRMLIGR